MNRKDRASRPLWFWINVVFTGLLLLGGVWFIATQLDAQEVTTAWRQVTPLFIWLSLFSFLLTLWLKIVRWKWLYGREATPLPILPFFHAFLLGLYVNAIMPLLRLGEVARTVALDNQTGVGKAKTITTLVVEKLLELIIIGLTLLLLLSTTVMTTLFAESYVTVWIAGVALLIFVGLVATAVYIDPLTHWLERWSERLPLRARRPFRNLVISGLAGLGGLREGTALVGVIALSLLIGFTSILTPYLLFLAFGLPYGLIEAAIIHVAISVALVPPSTPAKIGVFDGVVAFLLLQFGLKNDAVMVGYTVVFHLVLFLPQIVLGLIASWHTNWQWRTTPAS